MPSKRLNAKERKNQIIDAVLPLFSDRGVNSVTSKEMAIAASVSEALIYKHFPNKQTLYQSVFERVFADKLAEIEILSNAPVGFDGLLQFIEKFLDHIFLHESGIQTLLPRIVMRSIIEDGEFAKVFLNIISEKVAPYFAACLEECSKTGYLESFGAPHARFWFLHHCAVMFKFMISSETNLVDYKLNAEEMKKSLYEFVMRGIGFSEIRTQEGWTYINEKKEVKAS